MATKGYRTYHGRGDLGKTILIVLSCLLLLAAGAFFVAQRYLVYEADGSWHIVLPWGSGESEEPEPEPPLDIEVERPEPEPLPEPEPEPEPAQPLRIRETALGPEWEAGLDAAEAAAVRVKDDEGRLALAAQSVGGDVMARVSAGDEVAGAAALVAASERYTVARITALHDTVFSEVDRAASAILQVKKPGKRWFDHNSTCWLAPEKEKVRAYLCAVAADCAAMGFDELLFDEFGYPPQAGNRISNIDTSARTMSKEEALALLAAELRAAVPADVVLSVELDAQVVLAGGDACRGQDVAQLAEAFDRVYVETTLADIPALEAALGTHAEKLVPILSEPRAEGAYLLK